MCAPASACLPLLTRPVPSMMTWNKWNARSASRSCQKTRPPGCRKLPASDCAISTGTHCALASPHSGTTSVLQLSELRSSTMALRRQAFPTASSVSTIWKRGSGRPTGSRPSPTRPARSRLRSPACRPSSTSAGNLDAPLVVMDTAPAAVLGALLDPCLREQSRQLIVNIGNFHTLAFRLGPRGIEGVFEHHTGWLTPQRLEAYLRALADGSLSHSDVFGDHGHGALVLDPTPLPLDSPPGRYRPAAITPSRIIAAALLRRPLRRHDAYGLLRASPGNGRPASGCWRGHPRLTRRQDC